MSKKCRKFIYYQTHYSVIRSSAPFFQANVTRARSRLREARHHEITSQVQLCNGSPVLALVPFISHDFLLPLNLLAAEREMYRVVRDEQELLFLGLKPLSSQQQQLCPFLFRLPKALNYISQPPDWQSVVLRRCLSSNSTSYIPPNSFLD
jgi:hypothetical protein